MRRLLLAACLLVSLPFAATAHHSEAPNWCEVVAWPPHQSPYFCTLSCHDLDTLTVEVSGPELSVVEAYNTCGAGEECIGITSCFMYFQGQQGGDDVRTCALVRGTWARCAAF